MNRSIPAVLAIPHHVTAPRLGALVASWCLVPLLARVGLFEVNPGAADYVRPLEQLGAMALCLPVGAATVLLGDPSAWVLRTAKRSAPRVRGSWLLLVTVMASLLGLCVSPLRPSAVPFSHLGWLWLLLYAVGVLAVSLGGEWLGGITSAAVVALMTVPGLVPWNANVVYNLEARPALVIAALAVAVAAALTYSLIGDATGRREHPPAL